jgi:formate C-acetyltransferase
MTTGDEGRKTLDGASWRAVLERNRTGDFRQGRYDLCLFWRARVFRAAGDAPETLVRARAFRSVLDHLVVDPDEGLLLGHCRGFTGEELPDGCGEDEYGALVEVHRARGQRDFWAGFDHTLADYPTLLAIGIAGYRARVRASLDRYRDPEMQVFLHAVDLTLQAFSDFIFRLAGEARQAGRDTRAAVCTAIAKGPPRSFREALQLVWLTHLAFRSEGRHHMALGRLDQYLWPFYQRDLAQGRLTQEEALELLCHLWARLDEIGEVQNICIGGLTPQGQDGTNPLSYLCLEATRLVHSPHTNLSARFHDGTPEVFHRACFEVIRTGIGFPALFNDHVLQRGLVEIGIPVEVARDACMVGCIETMLPGRQPAWSDSRLNTPVYLLKAMERLAGEPDRSYERLVDLFRAEIAEGIAAHVANVNAHMARFPVERFPDPFLSALTRDCIERGRDVNDGGAEVPRFHGICMMGLATIADSLAAVKKLVFEDRRIEYDALLRALEDDFAGAEALRQMLLHAAPKYGNDDPYVDQIAAQVVLWTSAECLKHGMPDGGRYVSAMAANVQNISAGREVGATPDGRRAFTPLSDAASPYFGRDRKGPTAFLASVATPDYHRVLTGSVINMRFDPDHFQDRAGARRFLSFTRHFVAQRIPELQFNFSKNETLRAAQLEPENYRDLVVRVSGFSARFVELAPEVQADIMRRRAHR